MESDQIQKKLFERSDAATMEHVYSGLKSLKDWRAVHGDFQVRLPTSYHKLFYQDGTPLLKGENVHDRVRSGFLLVDAGDLLGAMREAMFRAAQTPDRQNYVEQFLKDVDRLKAEAEELRERIGSLENK